MKANTPQHRKVRELKHWLKAQGPSTLVSAEAIAVGMLELLWLTTAKQAPTGRLTGWSHAQLADAMGWEGSPPALVEKLVELRLLDRAENGELSVHDWPDHAPNFVQANAKRRGWWTTPSPEKPTPQPPGVSCKGASLAASLGESLGTSHRSLPPSQAKPSQNQAISPPPPPMPANTQTSAGDESGENAPAARAAAAAKTPGPPAANSPETEQTSARATGVNDALDEAGIRAAKTRTQILDHPGATLELIRRETAQGRLDGKRAGAVALNILAAADDAEKAAQRLAKARQAQASALATAEAAQARQRDERARRAKIDEADYATIPEAERADLWAAIVTAGNPAYRGPFQPGNPRHQDAVLRFWREVQALEGDTSAKPPVAGRVRA